MSVVMPMEVRTARFGPIETVTVPETARLRFPDGLPGFEEHADFALIDEEPYRPFVWLQSLHEPHVKFITLDVFLVRPDYDLVLSDADVAALDLRDPGEAQVFCILTIPETAEAMTANLKAPVVINRRRQLGRQVILPDDRYPLRHPLPLLGAGQEAS